MSADTLLKQPHNDLGADAYHEWWLEARRIYLDKNGRGHAHGMTAWLTMRCNNPSCGGRAVVREAAIARAFAPNGEPASYAEADR